MVLIFWTSGVLTVSTTDHFTQIQFLWSNYENVRIIENIEFYILFGIGLDAQLLSLKPPINISIFCTINHSNFAYRAAINLKISV